MRITNLGIKMSSLYMVPTWAPQIDLGDYSSESY